MSETGTRIVGSTLLVGLLDLVVIARSEGRGAAGIAIVAVFLLAASLLIPRSDSSATMAVLGLGVSAMAAVTHLLAM